VWQELTSYAEFRTENFLVVSLSNVERQL
jgi:hypothetical protein